MPKTSKERGRTPTVIEFDTPVLDRLRREAKAEQRSVAFLVRKIVKLYFHAIDSQATDGDDSNNLHVGATRDRSTFRPPPAPQKRFEPVMGILPPPPADAYGPVPEVYKKFAESPKRPREEHDGRDDAENMSACRERIAFRRKDDGAAENRIEILRVPFNEDAE